MNDNLLKIGEMAKLNHVTQHTLRHYDRLGILKPSYVDESSGYRYYNLEDCNRLNRILAYKAIGFSLEKIRELLDCELGMFRDELVQLSNDLEKERQKIETLKSYVDDQLGAITAVNEETLILQPTVRYIEDRYGFIIDVKAEMREVEIIETIADFEKRHGGHGEVQYKPMRLCHIENSAIVLDSYYAGIRNNGQVFRDKHKVNGGEYLVIDKKNSRINRQKCYKQLFEFAKMHGLKFEGTVLEILSIPHYITGNTKDTTIQIQMKLSE